MIIGLSGTPGTGKSTVSKLLNDMDFTILNLNEIAEQQNLLKSFDERRQTYEVDLKGLETFIKNRYEEMKICKEPKPWILEGHLAHLINILDVVIILRCHPSELRVRLTNKNWPSDKVQENLEAEALDVITVEAIEKYGEDKTFEIDTTNVKPTEIVKKILRIINGDRKEFKSGNIDWSEEILRWY